MAQKPTYPLGSPPMRQTIQTEIARAMPSVPKANPTNRSPTTQLSDSFQLLTKASTEPVPIYTGDRPWVLVKMTLVTAGPVSYGTKQLTGPVTSGGAALLVTNEERVVVCGKGQRIWMLATSANRVNIVIEPVPWLEQMYGQQEMQSATNQVLSEQLAAIGNLIRGLPGALAQSLGQILRGGK